MSWTSVWDRDKTDTQIFCPPLCTNLILLIKPCFVSQTSTGEELLVIERMET